MNRFLVTVVCACIGFAPGLFAQGFHAVHSPDGANVWAVGNNGLVFHSFNGGVTWISSTIGVKTLRGVATRGNAIWMVGDDGIYHRSQDGGTSWTSNTLDGGATLRSVVFASASAGWAAGDSGKVLHSTDGGSNWGVQTTGTAVKLNALAFADVQTGYAAGASGTLLKTTNAGITWQSVADSSWEKEFLAVSVLENSVYAVGVDGIVVKSGDGGASWERYDFRTDSRSDVRAVAFLDARNVLITGGGGYIRKSSGTLQSAEWMVHAFHAPINGMFFVDDQRGWTCSAANNIVMRTTDGGTTWSFPQATTVTYNWVQKLGTSGTSRGNAFAINAFNKEMLYVAVGTTVYASYNRGENWTAIATMPAGGSKVNSFYVSPKDTNVWVAAYGSPDRIVRTTNRGQTWTATLTRDFTEYGMPLEMDGSHPDTLLFGPEDGVVYRSTNFGATWDSLSRPNFRSPCDFVIVRDNPEVIWCGDGVTGSGQGQMFRSTNGGVNWSLIFTTSGSEIPTVANGDQNNKAGYATAWSSGGVRRTMDVGATWTSVATTGSAWGVDIAKDDPNVVMYGVYGGGTSFLSTNAGESFGTSSLTGSNYAILLYDRATMLAQQSGGIYKYVITYTVPTQTAAVAVVAPNGGEVWQYGTTSNITWTFANITNVKIEYKTGLGASWQTVVASTPAASGSYAWLIPNAPTTEAKVRVSDASASGVTDTSNGAFSIVAASISSQPSSLSFGEVAVGQVVTDTIRLFNNGSATLVVTSVSAGPSFSVSRASFTIPAGGSDTLLVAFAPGALQSYSDTLVFLSNAPAPLQLPVSGIGTNPNSVTEDGLPVKYILSQNYPNPFNPTTQITYALPKEGFVTLKVFNALGQEVATMVNDVQSPGWYTVEFSPSTEAIRSSGVYLYRLTAGSFVETRKMMLLK